MKVEEKMKKNKNCEISHIVRPEVTPYVYISGCVEHRRFKVTWARLWVYTAECMCRAYARLGCSWRTAQTSARTTECMCQAYARLRRVRGSAVRGIRHRRVLGSYIRYARLGWARDSVGRGARLGRDASTVQSRRTDWLHTV